MSERRRLVDDEVRAERVVDADFHIEPTAADLAPYVEDDRLRERLEEYGYPEHGHLLNPTLAKNADDPTLSGTRTLGRARNGEDVLDAIDDIGVDVVLVTFGKNQLASIQNPRVKTAICRAYNDYVEAEVTSVADEVKAIAPLPHWNPDAAVAELERVGDRPDVVGAYGWIGPYGLFGREEYDPLFDALTDRDLPLVLHHAADANRFEPNAQSMRTFVEWTWITPCTQAIQNTANMVMTGVFDDYPDLDVVYQEAGTNWLPFLAFRLDEVYADHTGDFKYTPRALDSGREHLERAPSEYVFENVHTCSQVFCKPDSPTDFRQTLELSRAGDTLIYSSDYPHYTFDPPSWMSRVLPDDVREDVLHGNAEEVFRL